MNAIGSQNIDDTFAVVHVLCQPACNEYQSDRRPAAGEKFTINGTTNLAAGDNLMVDITSSSFNPTSKTRPPDFPVPV